LPSEWRSFFTLLLQRTGGASGGGGTGGTITSAQISDATPTGRAVLTAPDAVAARAVIGAGTSSLTLQTVANSVTGGSVSAAYNSQGNTWSLSLRATGVAPGTYSSVTVAADGRVTAASDAGESLDYATALAYGL